MKNLDKPQIYSQYSSIPMKILMDQFTNMFIQISSIRQSSQVGSLLNYKIEQRLGSSFNLLNNLISLYNKGFQFTIRYKNIGNQISNHQSFYHKQDNKDNKIEIYKFFNDNKKPKSKSLLRIYSYIKVKCKNQNLKNLEIPTKDKMKSKTQKEIYKNYIAKRESNGSKPIETQVITTSLLRELGYSYQVERQKVMNKNQLNQEIHQIYVEHHNIICCNLLFKIAYLYDQETKEMLLASQNQILKCLIQSLIKLKIILNNLKTIDQSLTLINQARKLINKKNKLVQVERNKLLSLLKSAYRAENKIDRFNQYLQQQEKMSSGIESFILNELSPKNNIESILSLE
ncbi:unnamed protein product [Paramecium sonneborni]|uniref:Uncharacterized protein n=1 Tax=Paramecium sonneborni TaxID=65129 RepID=A0A8S1PZE6_9CILI|nr:unnamed protein product [Paramecium sonneborni]